VVRHGFQALTAKLGYDVRLSEDVALGPVIGADLSLFTFQDSTAVAASTSTFVYGGVQGRFDMGGERVGGRTAAYVPPPAPVGVTAPQPQAAPAPEPMVEETEPASPNISVSKDIISACKMSISATVPKFEYDQADLSQPDMDVIKQVAECFTTGPMKGQKLYLVGRADPRGNAEYNDTLAMKRASEVATHLQEQGVASEKIDRTSRGARDARGTDEPTWAADRRVDILVR
jgi:peptidoglycan-associated lipoprotein